MRNLLLTLLLFCCLPVFAQQDPHVVDSLQKRLTKAKDNDEKVELLGQLSLICINIDPARSENYSNEMMAVAELSRNRKLMVKARLNKGRRYGYLGDIRSNIDKAVAAYEEALTLARQHKLDEEIAGAYIGLSETYRSVPDLDKALNNCNQAISYISTLANDSMRIAGHLELGAVYTQRREKLLALRNFLAAQRIAEELKHPQLQRFCYRQLSAFYASIDDFDRAIDLQMKALQTRAIGNDPDYPYERISVLLQIGTLFSRKKDHTMAQRHFEHVLRYADTIKYQQAKVNAYVGLVNNYLYANKPGEAKAYFEQHPEITAYFNKMGLGAVIDQAYGFLYAELGKYDSAKHYYAKVAPSLAQDGSQTRQYTYYAYLGRMYKKSGELPQAIASYDKANTLAVQTGDLKLMRGTAMELDSLYQRTGDYKQSRMYASLSFRYKDSLDKLGKEKDLMQMEAADEQQRQERIAREQEELKKKRYSIQYTGITVAIASLFVLLAALGFLKVSRAVIRMVGFFTFLMFFEFLFLLFKKKIAIITHGEPWKDLAFMIVLAAVLLPLHHWLEEKVVHYLMSRRQRQEAADPLQRRIMAGKSGQPVEPYQ